MKAIQTTLPLGPVCGPCYRQLRRHPAPCTECAEVRPLIALSDRGEEVCGPCSGDDRNWTCNQCGRVDLLIAGAQCLTCTVTTRVTELLTGPDGRMRHQLDGVHRFLLKDNTPEQTLGLLRDAQWIQILRQLVAANKPISHSLLDELPPGNPINHLRAVLVHTGPLEPRDNDLILVEPWLKKFIAGLPPQNAHVLRTFAQWSVLPRTRRRAARLGNTASAPKYVRTRIEVAAHFMAWLDDNDRILAEASQHDVDTWVSSGATTRRRVRDFLKWTHARGLSADLQVRWLGREGLPQHILADDERWALLRRCLRDDDLPLHLRVAGALVLLYAQIPTRIAKLTVACITNTDTDTFIALHGQPVLLPPPLAALVSELAAHSSDQLHGTQPRTAVWLFPGSRPGTHVYPGRLTTALNNDVGIFVRPGRGAALSALAGDLPAPVIAELLGLSVAAATRWSALIARDNAEYVAARIASPDYE